MKKWIANKIFIIVLIAIAIIGIGKLANKWKQSKQIATTPILTDAEKSKVIVKPGRTEIITRDGDKQVIETKPGTRDTVVTVGKDGKVKVYAPTIGFIFEPGISFGIDEKDSLLGLDSQFFYWRKLNLLGGFAAPPYHGMKHKDIRAYAGISYSLMDIKLPNSSFFIAYNTKKAIMVGARVRF